MGDCRCGCGEEVSNGNFVTGHGQKLTARLMKEAGGLFLLQELVESAKAYSFGKMDLEYFLDLLRRIFPAKNSR